MYIPDNLDIYEMHEREKERRHRRLKRLGELEELTDDELPFVTVPDDYGSHRNLY